jgi:diaminohydroxyphosphoribosylaminopyrimidine deaminase/5-amino-6-(5-phosphoribosylamino)uracil reductase
LTKKALASVDEQHMRHALALGLRGQGRVWPNPAVGCVIVKDGFVVGRGWTQDGGRPHAEPIALAQAGAMARGATVYVTLEPCAHHGKTPPCANALIEAEVSRVVCAIGDEDTRVSGRGFQALRDAGIQVDIGVLSSDAAEDHRGFFKVAREGLPFVTLKLATSFDGRIATSTGDSQWITGANARRAVHMMRARHDAVLVGAGTVRADDPSLNVRGLGVSHQPVRVVISETLQGMARSDLQNGGWFVHPETADLSSLSSNARSVPYQGGLANALKAIANQGLTRIFCEGGARLAASLLDENLVDELVGMTAGVVIGGDGLGAVAPFGESVLTDAPRWKLVEYRSIGEDVLHRWRRA